MNPIDQYVAKRAGYFSAVKQYTDLTHMLLGFQVLTFQSHPGMTGAYYSAHRAIQKAYWNGTLFEATQQMELERALNEAVS